jgi:hypothetical protein
MAKSALRRQTPEVRAVCIKVHVRIRAGGVGQLTSLPRPSGNIDGTFKKLVGAFVKASFYHCVIGAADDVAGRIRMLTRARLLHWLIVLTLPPRYRLYEAPRVKRLYVINISSFLPFQELTRAQVCIDGTAVPFAWPR